MFRKEISINQTWQRESRCNYRAESSITMRESEIDIFLRTWSHQSDTLISKIGLSLPNITIIKCSSETYILSMK